MSTAASASVGMSKSAWDQRLLDMWLSLKNGIFLRNCIARNRREVPLGHLGRSLQRLADANPRQLLS